MYDELYGSWRAELENSELQKIPLDFFIRLASYFKKLKEESRMLEKRSPKAVLLNRERKKAEAMAAELIETRFRKIAVEAMMRKDVPVECLAEQEKTVAARISSDTTHYLEIAKDIFQGVAKTDPQNETHMTILRFLKPVPEIIGADMRAYGPYDREDIASLPTKNSVSLVSKKLAARIDVC